MFRGFTDKTFEFFLAIGFNNNREFFHENHDWYVNEVREPLRALAMDLGKVVEAIDPALETRAERSISRIYRDLRFSKDKSPYRDYMWIGFRLPKGGEDRDGCPGFYFDISANRAGFGMGTHLENRPMMNGLRRLILTDPDAVHEAFASVPPSLELHARQFKKLKRPDTVPPDLAELYMLRSFFYERNTTDFALLKSPALVEHIAEGYRAMTPLYRFISELDRLPNFDPDDLEKRGKHEL